MTYLTRNEMRSLIIAHPKWDEIRKAQNLQSHTMDSATIWRLAKELNIPLTREENPPMKITPSSFQSDPVQTEQPPIEATPQTAPMPVITEQSQIMNLTPAQMIEQALKALAQQSSAPLDENRVIELIRSHSSAPAHLKLTLQIDNRPVIEQEGLFHYRLPLILTAINAGLNVLLVGPAGSGKTTVANQISQLLSTSFYMTGAINSEFKLLGFIDAQGRIVSTEFRKAYIEGGLFLFDEVDGSNPNAILAFNAALANGHADFCDGTHKRHPDFRVIAAANTYGTGASRIYVGRQELDGATLDRFVMIDFPYDKALEAAIHGMPRPQNAPLPVELKPRHPDSVEAHMPEVITRLHKIRDAVEKLNVRHIVSPRAGIAYAKLYAQGWPLEEIADAVLWKGLDKLTRNKIQAELN